MRSKDRAKIKNKNLFPVLGQLLEIVLTGNILGVLSMFIFWERRKIYIPTDPLEK